MKKMLFIAILSCLGSMAFSQKVYFIYIQSEAGTPFYVKLGEKVYSSTASGYLILPKLVDSSYSLYLGQPGSQTKELRFSVPINNSDRGFLLKNFQEGWVLFDLQSMAVINPTPSTSGVMYESNVVKSDLFTRLLAKAVDDSTILMEPVLAKSEDPQKKAKKDKNELVVKSPDEAAVKDNIAMNDTVAAPTVATASNADSNILKDKADHDPANGITAVPAEIAASSPAVTQKDSILTHDTAAPGATAATKEISNSNDTAVLKEVTTPSQTIINETAAPKDAVVQNTQKVDSNLIGSAKPEQTEFKRSEVKKYAESSNFQGFGLTFIDTWNGVTDTIRLIIPNVVDAGVLVKPEQVNTDKQVIDESHKVATSSNSAVQSSEPVITNQKDSFQTAVVKQEAPANCKEEASNKDFLELRKNMASKDRGEEMLAEARKAFNEKCYTTEQIRKLSVLFYTQEGKFLFFKDAKPFVSDKDRFATLLFELNEDSFHERFKSLLEN